jgi:nucleoid-associated protein YgaU
MAVIKSTLAKMLIRAERNAPPSDPPTFEDRLTVQFNPKELKISKTVSWSNPASVEKTPGAPKVKTDKKKDVPQYDFNGGEPEQLTIELLFDTYESGDNVMGDVQKVIDLTLIEAHKSLGRPPICQLVWGPEVFFTGFLQSLSRTFSLFLEDGTPVRAELSCTFVEYMTPSMQKATTQTRTQRQSRKHVVQQGERIDAIASQHLGDPSRWREISDLNGLDNPSQLQPGAELNIPPMSE